MLAAGLALAGAQGALAAGNFTSFSIELTKPVQGLGGFRQCQVVFFDGVPARAKVDTLMEQALPICREMAGASDFQVMAFDHEAVLSERQASFAYIAFHRRLGCEQRVTWAQRTANIQDGC